jgi:hypothetical protein
MYSLTLISEPALDLILDHLYGRLENAEDDRRHFGTEEAFGTPIAPALQAVINRLTAIKAEGAIPAILDLPEEEAMEAAMALDDLAAIYGEDVERDAQDMIQETRERSILPPLDGEDDPPVSE